MEIHWRNPNELSLPVQQATEARLESLAEGHTDLIDIWIDIQKDAHHKQGNDRVALRCMARRSELLADGRDDDVESALRKALDSFEREVRRYREKNETRNQRPAPAPPHLGVIEQIFAEEGYGFIVTEDGRQVYFHQNALGDGLDMDNIEIGQPVALNVEPGDKGPQATFVEPPPPGFGT
jgi:cold shock CspA family protein/ribosome-associated translation inhibitor RaiA